MRMRRKPWARPELAACPFYIQEPSAYKGRWQEAFSAPRPLYLELGCGKGVFLAQMAARFPHWNFIGVDIKSEVLALAKRCVEQTYEEQGLGQPGNVVLLSQDIERIFQMLSPADTVERIYINFCNPWPTPSKYKHRLTHPRQLAAYREFLRDDGEIWFKTDDLPLFEQSKEYFTACGFTLTFVTEDLRRSGFTESPDTEHERMFEGKGIPTKFLIAKKDRPLTLSKEEIFAYGKD